MKNKYLETLLLYYEEEIMGEGYFIALSEHFTEPHQKDKMLLMAKVESYAAKAILPLLRKYKLIPRENRLLKDIGKKGLKKVSHLTWDEFIDDIYINFPKYLVEFAELEKMAPESDTGMIKILTDHEIAAIEFAKLEMKGNTNSIDPLVKYMEN